MRWIRAIGGILSTGAMLVVMRWLFKPGANVASDVQAVRRWARGAGDQVRAWARELGACIWRRYGPVTQPMRSAWEALRERYVLGEFGAEGT